MAEGNTRKDTRETFFLSLCITILGWEDIGWFHSSSHKKSIHPKLFLVIKSDLYLLVGKSKYV